MRAIEYRINGIERAISSSLIGNPLPAARKQFGPEALRRHLSMVLPYYTCHRGSAVFHRLLHAPDISDV
jgi:hypothetical protein